MLIKRTVFWGSAIGLFLWCSSCDSSADPPVSEQLIGERLQAISQPIGYWEWVPAADEIAFSQSYGYYPSRWSVKAVDAETKSVRDILPRQDGFVSRFKLLSPYIYYSDSGTLRRNRQGVRHPPETVVDWDSDSYFSVTPDHRWLIWLEPTSRLLLYNLESRTQQEIATNLAFGSALFLAPDGTSVVAVQWDPQNTADWIDLSTGLSQRIPLPCPWREGSLLVWGEDATPELYVACDGSFHQIIAGGTSNVVLSIAGEIGAWSPTLDRVSFWRLRCPGGMSGPLCLHAERDLWVQHLNQNEPSMIGRIVLNVASGTPDIGPALFSFDGRFVGFTLNAGSPHDGVYVTRSDGASK